MATNQGSSTQLWVFSLVLAAASGACGQTASVRESFQALLQREDAFQASGPDEVMRFGKQVAAASPDEIAAALPVMCATLSSRDSKVRRVGVSAILAVGLRKDSLSLLSKYMGAVAGMLDSPDAPEQRMGVVILSALISRAPTPPAGALPPLIAFLKRTDRDVEAQAGAISALVDAAVDDEAASAIDQFLARDLSPQTRVVSLYGLTSPKLVLHPIVISRMISLLSGGDVMVKTTAIDSLTRIGPQALLLAEPVLVKLSEDAATPDSLQSAAKTALGKIGHRLE